MSWNILLVGTRAAVSAAVVQHTEFPMATSVAKYVAFAADSNPWVSVETRGDGANVQKLRIKFFTPVEESPVEVPLPTEAPPDAPAPAAA